VYSATPDVRIDTHPAPPRNQASRRLRQVTAFFRHLGRVVSNRAQKSKLDSRRACSRSPALHRVAPAKEREVSKHVSGVDVVFLSDAMRTRDAGELNKCEVSGSGCNCLSIDGKQATSCQEICLCSSRRRALARYISVMAVQKGRHCIRALGLILLGSICY
jgi:hypothetical protein